MSQSPKPLSCPLCKSIDVHSFEQAHQRDYFGCDVCKLVFLNPEQRLDYRDEIARYEAYENDPTDIGYRDFLSRVADPLANVLQLGAMGLDYGCGPGPTLSLLLEEKGFPTTNYDPAFVPEKSVLRRSYDFITCTETVEHFFYPDEELDRLDHLLRPGGWLAVMTEVWSEACTLADWSYARDPTHVCFYHQKTMVWIAEHCGWQMQSPHRNVFLFQKL
ncbi:MAG: class I SAM-dependent methyltransferase [Candidatus Latescibacteria bacterium]|nr:class I SAM-dependent methyltransferase [Candidatus Latescibacterota bacterium]